MTHETALITGASSGLGLDFAEELARRNYDLVLTARRFERLKTLAEKLERTYHNQVRVIPADLSEPTSVEQLLAELEANKISIDFLINNAGAGTGRAFLDKNAEHWQNQIQVNVNSLVTLTRRLLPDMITKGSGKILNVASIAAFQAIPWFGIYAATKAFVLSFTESLAEEVKDQGISVCCLCPGPVRTEFSDKAELDETRAPSFAWMSPRDVVIQGLLDLEKKKVLSIPGLMNRILVDSEKFLPRKIISQLAAMFYRP